MKNILNHLNKENLNFINAHQSERKLAHPSQETAPKPFRPAIKYLDLHAESATK
jgi:hypothetical protein